MSWRGSNYTHYNKLSAVGQLKRSIVASSNRLITQYWIPWNRHEKLYHRRHPGRCLLDHNHRLGIGAIALPALAQGYPNRPVTFIVPFTPGTGIDIIARTFGQQLTQRWGQPFIIDNRAGSSGNIGAEMVAGRVNAMFMPIHTALPFLLRNQLRMLAVVAAELSPVVPNVPTMKEAGFPGIQVENWYGVMAPAATPAKIVTRINSEINAMLKTPETSGMLSKQGLQPIGGAPSRLTDLIRSEQQRWPRVVAAARIAAD